MELSLRQGDILVPEEQGDDDIILPAFTSRDASGLLLPPSTSILRYPAITMWKDSMIHHDVPVLIIGPQSKLDPTARIIGNGQNLLFIPRGFFPENRPENWGHVFFYDPVTRVLDASDMTVLGGMINGLRLARVMHYLRGNNDNNPPQATPFTVV